MPPTIPDTRRETNPETATRLQREAGGSANPAILQAGDQAHILVSTPRIRFASLTPNQRELLVRKLVYLSGERDRYTAVYILPERMAMVIARLTQYIAGLPEPVQESEKLALALWWKLDSDRRMDEQNAKVRAMYELSRFVGVQK